MNLEFVNLTGKIALVTGGARGIGMESGVLMARCGATVCLADINADAAEETARELRGRNLAVDGYAVDIADENSIKALMAEIDAKHGRLDILVNNAGILDPVSVPELTADRWDRVINVNLRGAQFCSQQAMSRFIAAGGGKIVNVASMAGQAGGWLSGVHYSAAKGGLIALTKSYARYGASHGVNVNCVAPGFMHTEMTKDRADNSADIPLGRLGTALDAAKAVFFLASPLSDYITGATVDVNGGSYMR